MGKRLFAVWGCLDAAYLASGILALVFAIVIRMQGGTGGPPNDATLRRLVVSDTFLNAGIALGIIIIASWLVSLYGITSARKISKTCTDGLMWFNWTIVGSTITTIVVGVLIWFFTLRPRAAFADIWRAQTPATQTYLQNTLQCCGYWDASTAGLFTAPTGFCAAVAAGTNTTAVQPCVNPIGAFEDYLLNNVFSTTFGFVAIQISLVLITTGLIQSQMEEYRFTLIDAKRGGRKGGFV